MRATKNQFRFKHFLINQDNCAMKVCTDACIFGAYIEVNNATHILDIGAGTGLLSLMTAQRCDANVIGVEIDNLAAKQAQVNIEATNWSNRVQILNVSLQEYAKNTRQKFDLIVSNPPFFQNSLLSQNNEKNIAKHLQNLTLTELANCATSLLVDNGVFWVMLPQYEMLAFENILNDRKMYCQSQLELKSYVTQQNIFRVIKSFSFSKKENLIIQQESIYIKVNEYTEWFKILLKNYYLNL